uniref:Uncharacterized protein LOC114338565 n=1 Tax=Diabrotica virgifera virgifera TaxID=50390 RepID=A0A6P7GME5_DIAVI
MAANAKAEFSRIFKLTVLLTLSKGDIKDRRRRRRFFPTEVLESSLATSGDDRERSDLNATASQSQTSTVSSPITASFSSSSTSKITTPKKSELSVHMENARRGVTPAFSEMGKYKPYANTKRVVTSSPKSSTTRFNADSTQSSNSLPRKSSSPSNTRVIVSDDERTKAIASRMEGLSALTKQTLARVERLTSKTRESPRKDLPRAHESSSSPIKQIDQKMKKKTPERSLLSSMLKKKSVDETPSIVIESSVPASPASGPVSILKRKVSQDEHKQDGSRHSSTHTPPVTFSPNVLEPTTSKRKQGILKKRRSLDESTVMRHRSCSPDVANKADSRSILKNQRRSSLEELRRTRSPETPLQGILKRRTSRHDEDDHSLNSPQSILKRKSGASSAGSTSSTPHVSITTAVILAAAGGAEMVLEPEADAVKPILKKKSFSEEYSHYSDTPVDVPKPILKKKSSTDTDDSEEKPKPILKLPRTSIERDILESNQDFRPFKHTSSSETECEVRPILKQNSREEPVRQRLSFCSEHTNIRDEPRPRTSRRSHTICTDFNVGDFNLDTRERDEMLNKPRPFSVRDLVKSFETDCSTGAIPKRSSLKRNSDRYKTQPITSNELEARKFGKQELCDIKDRRRRRRFFPTEVLESSLATSGDDRERSDLNATASQSQTSTVSSPITASFSSSSTSKITTPKKSELSVHMENARRGVTPAFSEMGKYKPYANTKRVVTSSPKSSTTRFNADSTQSSNSLPRKSSSPSNTRVIVSDDERTKAIASRMEGLSALTKQTLARVERLTSKTRESPRKDLPRAHESSSSPIKQIDQKMKKKTPERSLLSSMLKKKSVDETPSIVIESSVPASPASGPVSILKRKVSQDEHKQDGSRHSSTHTPPVTFSPNVLEPTTSKRKQGILKKRRSLDESTVMRHRSCSPDVANKADSRSILKNQRRSSLEELRRTRSPDTPLQGILKRRTSRHDEDDHSLNSPQSILKRKSGASSAGSTSSTPHVSITTAVILAAAGGAEMVLEPEADAVKPILKKKSFSEEYSHYSDTPVDVPKPILKKKSSTDTDDSEEKPKPILKLPRTSIERDILESNQDFRPFKHTSSSETECEVRPILKQNSREEPVRQRLSFCSEHTNIRDEPRPRTSRRSHTICTDFNVGDFNLDTRERDEMLNKPRPFSVRDLVKSFETDCSTGAIPKRSSLKRNSDRYKTQPITSNELEASRHLVKSPQQFNEDDIKSNFSHTFDVHSLLDFTTSLDNDSNLNSFFSSSLHNQTNTESFTCGKMSSDSAFQSLGDGLELEQDEDSVHESEKEQIKPKSKQPSPLELQMKAVAEEAKKMKLAKATEDLHNSEKRSILKNPPEAPAVHHRNGSPPPKKSSLKKFNSFNAPAGRRPILKVETSPDKDDEGISCNDSASSSDSDASSNAAREGAKSDEQSVGKKVGKWSDSTSEGESSGGREVRSIFQNENRLKIKQTLEGVLSKSRSQNSVGNDYSQLSPKKTVTVRRSQTQNEMPQAIADLRAKLQERGESEWKKRVSLNNNASDELKLLKEKNRYNDELSEKSLLASKKDELDAASRHWKSRVEKSDAEKFSVAGKMGEKIKQTIPTINIPAATDSNKRTPQAKRFKLKDGPDSTPTSPEKNSNFDLTRSKSLSYSASLISKTGKYYF